MWVYTYFKNLLKVCRIWQDNPFWQNQPYQMMIAGCCTESKSPYGVLSMSEGVTESQFGVIIMALLRSDWGHVVLEATNYRIERDICYTGQQ